MPDRDYYVSNHPKMAAIRKEYYRHVAAVLNLAGLADAQNRAQRIVALESKIARVHATRVESEDVHTVMRWQKDDLPRKAPGLDWSALLEAAQLSDESVFFVWQPKAVTGLSALVASEPLESWKDWLTFHAIEETASFLPRAFVAEHFAFDGKRSTAFPSYANAGSAVSTSRALHWAKRWASSTSSGIFHPK